MKKRKIFLFLNVGKIGIISNIDFKIVEKSGVICKNSTLS